MSLHLAERTPEADQRENLAAEGVRFAEAAIALGAMETARCIIAEGNWGYNRAPWKKEFDRFLDDIGGSDR